MRSFQNNWSCAAHFLFDVHADIVEERPVAHRIDGIDVPPPHFLVAAVAPARFVVLADDV